MKINIGKNGKVYYLNSDAQCYWVSKEKKIENGKNAGSCLESLVSGYYQNAQGVLKDPSVNRVRDIDKTTLEKFSDAILRVEERKEKTVTEIKDCRISQKKVRIQLTDDYLLDGDDMSFCVKIFKTTAKGQPYDKRISGYYKRLPDLMNSFIDTKIRSSDANSITGLNNAIKDMWKLVEIMITTIKNESDTVTFDTCALDPD